MVERQTKHMYGTLDLLILRAVSSGPLHGYGIGQWLERRSGGRICVGESSLYPALYRLRERGFLESEWGVSELDRRAKYYRITGAGEQSLRQNAADWTDFTKAVVTVLGGDLFGSTRNT